jgi:hypothetical protein
MASPLADLGAAAMAPSTSSAARAHPARASAAIVAALPGAAAARRTDGGAEPATPAAAGPLSRARRRPNDQPPITFLLHCGRRLVLRNGWAPGGAASLASLATALSPPPRSLPARAAFRYWIDYQARAL